MLTLTTDAESYIMPSLTLITFLSSSPRPIQYNLPQRNTLTGLELGANSVQFHGLLTWQDLLYQQQVSRAFSNQRHHRPTRKSTPSYPHTSIQPSHHACELQRSANLLPAVPGPSTEQTSTTCSEIDVDVDVNVSVPLPCPSIGRRGRDLYRQHTPFPASIYRIPSFVQGFDQRMSRALQHVEGCQGQGGSASWQFRTKVWAGP